MAQREKRIVGRIALGLVCLVWAMGCESSEHSVPSTAPSSVELPPAKVSAASEDATPTLTPVEEAAEIEPPVFEPTRDDIIPSRTSEDPNATRFLVVGDSQVQGYFGRGLDYLLRAGLLNTRVTTYGVCASNPLSWTTARRHLCGRMVRSEDFEPQPNIQINEKAGIVRTAGHTPLLLDLLDVHQPDILVLALGENAKMASGEFIRKATVPLMRHIECYRAGVSDPSVCDMLDDGALEQALWAPQRKLSCVWVLPPWTSDEQSPHRLQRLMNHYERSIGTACMTIDSRALTCRAGVAGHTKLCKPDWAGVHFSLRRARTWSLSVVDALTKMLDLAPMSEEFRAAIIKDWKLRL